MIETNLRGVFFDLDGTLITDRDTIGRPAALAEAWAEAFGRPVASDDLEAAIRAAYEERFLHGRPGYADLAHLGLRDFLEQLLDGMRQRLAVPDRGESDRFLLAWGEIERQALAVAPGAIAVLQALRDAGLTLGLITNGPSCLQREKLALLDLTPHLDHIVVDTEFGCPKPDPRIFAHAASLAGLAPHQLLFVGDTPEADIAGATGAGWTAVWVRPPGQPFPPGLPAPHHTIDALPELLDLEEIRQPTTRNRKRRSYTAGDRVRLSAAGKARLRQMPEAWGMHAAAARDEVGEVIEVIEAEGPLPGEDGAVIALSVEFESGSVYNWDVEQFEPA